MKLNNQLQKLREEKKLIIEALKQAQAKASTVQRKREARAKIIVGGALLGSPESEREALLSMILPRMIERDRTFLSEFLAGEQPTNPNAPQLEREGANEPVTRM